MLQRCWERPDPMGAASSHPPRSGKSNPFSRVYFSLHRLRSWGMLSREKEEMGPGGDTDSMEWRSGKAGSGSVPQGTVGRGCSSGHGGLGVWEFGNLGVCKFGSLGIWEFGIWESHIPQGTARQGCSSWDRNLEIWEFGAVHELLETAPAVLCSTVTVPTAVPVPLPPREHGWDRRGHVWGRAEPPGGSGNAELWLWALQMFALWVSWQGHGDRAGNVPRAGTRHFPELSALPGIYHAGIWAGRVRAPGFRDTRWKKGRKMDG